MAMEGALRGKGPIRRLLLHREQHGGLRQHAAGCVRAAGSLIADRRLVVPLFASSACVPGPGLGPGKEVTKERGDDRERAIAEGQPMAVARDRPAVLLVD